MSWEEYPKQQHEDPQVSSPPVEDMSCAEALAEAQAAAEHWRARALDLPSPVDEQARERVAEAIYEVVRAKQPKWPPWYERDEHQRESWYRSADAALAAARSVSAQARERTPWTGRALFERFEHEAERGRGWPRLSKVGKHSWDALAEQIEGEVLAGPRGQDEQQLADAMTLLDRWLHKMGAVERENTRTMTEDFLAAAAVSPVPEDAGDERQPDLLAVEKLSRARGLGEAIMRCRGDDCGVREIAAEIVSLLAAVSSVAQAPTPEDERICGVICNCGPSGEPLACAFKPGHDDGHSWATLPTFGGADA